MRILILEDNKQLCALIVSYLKKELLVDSAYNTDDLKAYLKRYNYDAILLDRNIDNQDIGLSLIPFIKEKNSNTAIIIISAYGNVSDKVDGLNLGADDYLEKPFDNEELLARIYAQVRKRVRQSLISFKDLKFDLLDYKTNYKGTSIEFSKKEADLLFYLLKNQNKIVSNTELIDAMYLHPENVADSTIRVTIGNIRKKLPFNIIKTIKTRGYIIEN